MYLFSYVSNPDPEDITEEEIRLLELQDQAEELARGGMGDRSIVKQLGISRSLVRGWIQHIVDRRKAHLDQAKQLAIELYPKLGIGRKVHEQLKEEGFEVSYGAVKKWIKHLPSIRQQELDQAKQRAIELYPESGNGRKVHEQLKEEGFEVSYAIVRQWVEDLPSFKQRAIELYPKLGTVRKVYDQLKEEGFEGARGTIYDWVEYLPPPKQQKLDQAKQRAIELYPKLGIGRKVHEQLKEEGFEVSYGTVKKWIKHLQQQAQETQKSLRLQVIELYKKLRVAPEVARILNVAPRDVQRWTKHLTSYQQHQRQIAIWLFDPALRGHHLDSRGTLSEIAKIVGVTRETISAWTKHLRQPRSLRRYNPDPEEITEAETRILELQDEAEELSRGGMGVVKIAEKLGIVAGGYPSPWHVSKWIQHIIDERQKERKKELEQKYLRVMELYEEKPPGPGRGDLERRLREIAEEVEVGRTTVHGWTEHLRASGEESRKIWVEKHRKAIKLYKEIGRLDPKEARRIYGKGILRGRSTAIARIIGGVSPAAIDNWTRHLKLSEEEQKEETEKERLRTIELYKKLGSVLEVAKIIGRKTDTIHTWLREAGVIHSPWRGRPKYSKGELEKKRLLAIELYDPALKGTQIPEFSGHLSEIAKVVGVTRGTITRWTKGQTS